MGLTASPCWTVLKGILHKVLGILYWQIVCNSKCSCYVWEPETWCGWGRENYNKRKTIPCILVRLGIGFLGLLASCPCLPTAPPSPNQAAKGASSWKPAESSQPWEMQEPLESWGSSRERELEGGFCTYVKVTVTAICSSGDNIANLLFIVKWGEKMSQLHFDEACYWGNKGTCTSEQKFLPWDHYLISPLSLCFYHHPVTL